MNDKVVRQHQLEDDGHTDGGGYGQPAFALGDAAPGWFDLTLRRSGRGQLGFDHSFDMTQVIVQSGEHAGQGCIDPARII